MSSAQATPSQAGRDANLHRAARLGARGAEVLLVLVIAWLAAQALWFTLYGAEIRRLEIDTRLARGGGGDVARDLSSLQSFDVFASRAGAEAAPAGDAPETRLNLVLRGVRTGASPQDGAAVIESPGQGQRALPSGAEIADGVRLVEIYSDRVIINRRGARETLYLREEARRNARAAAAPRTSAPAPVSAPVSSTAGPGAGALTGEPDPALAAGLETEDWVDGLRLEPVLDGGGLTGLRVRDNTRLEVLRAAGLLPGDVIRSVNGTRLDGADAARAVAATFETAGQARLEIERAGAPVVLTIPLNPGG
ncbi:MAG: type II secretion system protein N [Oceanicaulis sp.]